MNSTPHTDPNDKAVTGQQEQQRTGETPVAWPLRRLGLKVLDLAGSLDYYTRLGLSIMRDKREW